MKKIKFRVWDKRHKEMCSVTDIQLWCNHVHYSQDDSGIGKGNYPDDVEIMQYTGLKDKNGKEIYEGDILQVDDSEDKSTCKVIFYEGSFCQDHGIDEEGFLIVIPLDKKTLGIWEVIGNIYDNPELLEGER